MGVAAVIGSLTVGLTLFPGEAAVAAPAHGKVPMVQIVTRSVAGTQTSMLATVSGASLYIDLNTTPCKTTCLTVWPQLLMARGTGRPSGAFNLHTKGAGGGFRQVTYLGERLYTFSSDSGSSVNGDGVGGFYVAKVAGGY